MSKRSPSVTEQFPGITHILGYNCQALNPFRHRPSSFDLRNPLQGWLFDRNHALIGKIGQDIPNPMPKPKWWQFWEEWEPTIFEKETILDAIKRYDADKAVGYILYIELMRSSIPPRLIPSYKVCSIPHRFTSWTEYDTWVKEDEQKTRDWQRHDDQLAAQDAKRWDTGTVKKSELANRKFSGRQLEFITRAVACSNITLKEDYYPGKKVTVYIEDVDYDDYTTEGVINEIKNRFADWTVVEKIHGSKNTLELTFE